MKENKLSVANNLNVEVIEPNWDPENAKHLVPTQTVPKDPQIKNLSDQYTGYLYLEIQVPIVNAKIYNEESKEVIGPERVELFTYTPSDKFILLEEFENEDYIIRRYAYPDIIEPLGTTPTIFDEVTVTNLASGEGVSCQHNINVIGYGIQSEGFSSYEDAWIAYKNQNGLKSGGEVGNKVSAVLIAGATGNKLQFMNNTPSVGDMLDTGEVIEVVEDVEHLPAGDRSPLVSPENIGTVATVEDVVATKPENTVNWFKDMDSVTEIDISGLSVTSDTPIDGVFVGCTSLMRVRCDDTSILVSALGSDFTQISAGGVFERNTKSLLDADGNLTITLNGRASSVSIGDFDLKAMSPVELEQLCYDLIELIETTSKTIIWTENVSGQIEGTSIASGEWPTTKASVQKWANSIRFKIFSVTDSNTQIGVGFNLVPAGQVKPLVDGFASRGIDCTAVFSIKQS